MAAMCGRLDGWEDGKRWGPGEWAVFCTVQIAEVFFVRLGVCFVCTTAAPTQLGLEHTRGRKSGGGHDGYSTGTFCLGVTSRCAKQGGEMRGNLPRNNARQAVKSNDKFARTRPEFNWKRKSKRKRFLQGDLHVRRCEWDGFLVGNVFAGVG